MNPGSGPECSTDPPAERHLIWGGLLIAGALLIGIVFWFELLMGGEHVSWPSDIGALTDKTWILSRYSPDGRMRASIGLLDRRSPSLLWLEIRDLDSSRRQILWSAEGMDPIRIAALDVDWLADRVLSVDLLLTLKASGAVAPDPEDLPTTVKVGFELVTVLWE